MTKTTQRRLHRAKAAAYLAPLQAANSADGQPDIDWSTLDAVPLWCFESTEYINKLQLVCGANILAPTISNWIDGKRIQEVRALVGPMAFAAVARSCATTEDTTELAVTEDVPEALAKGGASVLLSSIENAEVRALLAKQFPMNVEPINHAIAKTVYEASLNIVHQAIVSEKMASNEAQIEQIAENER